MKIGLMGIAIVSAWLVGCTMSCHTALCVGKWVSLALVDDAGKPVAARGQVSYSHHSDESFDCTVPADSQRDDIPCEDGVLTLPPANNPDDTIKVRFELPDGTLTDFQPVALHIETKEHPDFNGPGCDCSSYDGTTEPVTVPEAAR